MRSPTASRLLMLGPLALGLLTASAGPAMAQTSPAEAVLACARLTEGAERLACYDRTVPGLRGGAAAPALPTAPAAPATPAQTFGAEQLPRPATSATSGEGAEELSAKVVRIGPDPERRDRMMITLDNDQVWVQRESIRFQLRVGDAVVIKPAILGTYNLVRDGSNAILKVRRVR